MTVCCRDAIVAGVRIGCVSFIAAGRGTRTSRSRYRRLDVVSGNRCVAHQNNDDDRQHHSCRPVAVVGPAQGVGFAEVVSERGAQRTRQHVRHPEGAYLIETSELPKEPGQRDEDREDHPGRKVAQVQGHGREVTERGTEGKCRKYRRPVINLSALSDDTVNRKCSLAALPIPKNEPQHQRPKDSGHRNRAVRS